MTTQPGQPETVALEAFIADWLAPETADEDDLWHDRLEAALRESAAAARAEAFAEIRRGVEAAPVLMREMFGSGDDRTVTDLIDRAAVTALLPSVPPEEK